MHGASNVGTFCCTMEISNTRLVKLKLLLKSKWII